jgi:hypothetical protein
VLAQLEARSDVDAAEVDRRGELLRVRLRDGALVTAIREDLERLGFLAEDAPADTDGVRWHGRSAVGELSREEARVIAARVVPLFGAANDLDRTEIDVVSAVVVDALHACFIGRLDIGAAPGGLAPSCGRAVEAATRRQLGVERAAALGHAIEADLAGTSPA